MPPSETNRSRLPYRFDSPLGSEEIVIEESYMQDVHATGFRTWSSAIHLAHRMLVDPSQFFSVQNRSDTEPLRLLELGSGTGLAGIAACRALAQLPGRAQVVLSDMDRTTLDILCKNVQRNDISLEVKTRVHANIAHLDWANVRASALQPFDIIIGADIVYEPDHADLIYEVVDCLLARNPQSSFHLVLVTRPTHTNDIQALDERFGGMTSYPGEPMLTIVRRETIEATEEDTYPYGHRYYEIRWRGLPET